MRTTPIIFAVTTALCLSSPSPAQAATEAFADPGKGSADVGTTQYPVPAGAVFVAPWGNDASPGDSSRPFRTVTRAAAAAPWGGTVVMRGGTYHESVTLPHDRPLTVQSYPGEAAWLDGARPVSGWIQEGSVWRVDGWTVDLDSSPSLFRGQPEHNGENMQFINPAFPMAAHPDQLWIDGVELKQVASRSQVTAGTFYVDGQNDTLYTGTNPVGRRVEASDLARAVTVQSPNTTLKGIGIRRFAPSVPDQGAVNSYWPGLTLENIVVAESSTAGIGIYGANSTLRNVTVSGSGQLGIGASQAHNLTMDNVAVIGSNKERFNISPLAGGIKVTTTTGVSLRNSLVADSHGSGFWVDESVYDATTVGNTIRDNTGRGIFYELSEKGVIESNTVTGSGEYGISIYNTGNVRVRNNVVKSRGEALIIFQDGRKPGAPGMPGSENAHSDMTWQTRNLDIQHNYFSGDKSSVSPATALVRVYGNGRLDLRAGSAHNIVLNNNTYAWPGARPTALLWYSISQSGDSFVEYPDLGPLTTQLGQEAQGRVAGKS